MNHEIQEMVDRETHARYMKDAETLVSIFHPDMVWPWPPIPHAHDPVEWMFPQGRLDRQRWKQSWQELFDTYDLIHNQRRTVKIVVSAEGDGAFAVVDVDTPRRHKETGSTFTGKEGLVKGTPELAMDGNSSITQDFSTTNMEPEPGSKALVHYQWFDVA